MGHNVGNAAVTSSPAERIRQNRDELPRVLTNRQSLRGYRTTRSPPGPAGHEHAEARGESESTEVRRQRGSAPPGASARRARPETPDEGRRGGLYRRAFPTRTEPAQPAWSSTRPQPEQGWLASLGVQLWYRGEERPLLRVEPRRPFRRRPGHLALRFPVALHVAFQGPTDHLGEGLPALLRDGLGLQPHGSGHPDGPLRGLGLVGRSTVSQDRGPRS